MNLEQLFEDYKDNLKEIYEEYDLDNHAIKKIQDAVEEVLSSQSFVDPMDFLSIISSVASSTYYTNKKGKDKNLTYKNILKRVNHAVGLYIDADIEYDLANDYSDEKHI